MQHKFSLVCLKLIDFLSTFKLQTDKRKLFGCIMTNLTTAIDNIITTHADYQAANGIALWPKYSRSANVLTDEVLYIRIPALENKRVTGMDSKAITGEDASISKAGAQSEEMNLIN